MAKCYFPDCIRPSEFRPVVVVRAPEGDEPIVSMPLPAEFCRRHREYLADEGLVIEIEGWERR